MLHFWVLHIFWRQSDFLVSRRQKTRPITTATVLSVRSTLLITQFSIVGLNTLSLIFTLLVKRLLLVLFVCFMFRLHRSMLTYSQRVYRVYSSLIFGLVFMLLRDLVQTAEACWRVLIPDG
jgi:hypothetical protein